MKIKEVAYSMKKQFIPFLNALPSVLSGTLIMYICGIPINIYIQNIICLIIFSVLAGTYISTQCVIKPNMRYLIVIINALLLLSSLFFKGISDVHRWINIGPIALNVAFISVPILLISIYNFSNSGHLQTCYSLILIIAVILFLQPDASMLTAFFVSLIPFYHANGNKFWKYSWIILLILSGISWMNVDNLEPVSYVEDIILLAINISWGYLFCCIFSFLVLLWPFLKRNNCKQYREISTSLGLFFLCLIASTLFGNFPVPLIGYGISPIVGYLASVSYVEKNKI